MEIVILGFITSFVIVLFATPSLIKVAKLKHLVDEPSEERKLHSHSIPTIGGIIIFAAAIFAYALWFPTSDLNTGGGASSIMESFDHFKYLIASLLILFFVGVKDDIIGTAPIKKLAAHFMVGFILVVMAEIKITSMQGIFGVYNLPDWTSIALSMFVYIVIVNGLNLIDGIDGLAAGIGLISALLFGTWFYLAKDVPLALLSACLVGALLGFLVFNFSPARLFMGDSGSMIIGAIISVLAIQFIEHDTSNMPKVLQELHVPLLAMSILSYPLVDTLRVFFIRAVRGSSPFSADRNHIHHRLIRLGYSHRRTVTTLYTLNIVVVLVMFLLKDLKPTLAFFVLLVCAFAIYLSPYLLKAKE
ncbi:MAG: UDP-GlcNAc:undecaprenyl-phosphate GlcNAc-1-phosphate transferase [Ulvibacter sp.]